jgi:hypothetical protein
MLQSGISLRKVSLTTCLLTLFSVGMAGQNLPYGLKPGGSLTTKATMARATPTVRLAAAAETTTQYAFLLSGAAVVRPGADSRLFVEAGSITVNASGQVVSGKADYNFAGGNGVALPITGSYTGNTLTLTSQYGSQTFAMTVATNNGAITSASLLQTDGSSGLSGVLIPQTAGVTPAGNFSFNMKGQTFEVNGVPDAVAATGSMTVDGQSVSGTASFFVGDLGHDSFLQTLDVPYNAAISAPDQSGRFTLTFTYSDGTTSFDAHFAAYAVNAGRFVFIPIDPLNEQTPIVYGNAVQ